MLQEVENAIAGDQGLDQLAGQIGQIGGDAGAQPGGVYVTTIEVGGSRLPPGGGGLGEVTRVPEGDSGGGLGSSTGAAPPAPTPDFLPSEILTTIPAVTFSPSSARGSGGFVPGEPGNVPIGTGTGNTPIGTGIAPIGTGTAPIRTGTGQPSREVNATSTVGNAIPGTGNPQRGSGNLPAGTATRLQSGAGPVIIFTTSTVIQGPHSQLVNATQVPGVAPSVGVGGTGSIPTFAPTVTTTRKCSRYIFYST